MSKKPTLQEITNYIDNEVKEGRVRIGFEDVNGNRAKLTYIYKRMVSGFMLIKSEYSTKVRTEPIFLCGENIDVSYDLEDYDKVIGTIPAMNCFAVFCLVPKNVPFSKLNVKPNPVKSVLLGYEYPNSEHPEWIEQYKKEFINAFDYEGKEDLSYTDDEDIDNEIQDSEDGEDSEDSEDDDIETIEELLAKYDEKDSRSGVSK